MKNQQGYTLVEIALVLTVALMMASWLVANYYQSAQYEQEKQVEGEIANIKKAIVNYAANHSNKSYILYNAGATRRVSWRLPSGRPYLPCPDVNGDGLEDRRAFASGVSLAVTSGAGGALETGADCYRDKGMVPWRTLNVPPRDPWGNFYSYRVGRNFSNAAVGFDQETRADQGRYTRLLSREVVASITIAVRSNVSSNTFISRSARSAAASANPASGLLLWTGNLMSEDAPSIICVEAPCGILSSSVITLIAGERLNNLTVAETSGYNLPVGVYTRYIAPSIINGAPIVIVSHGPNGHGAAYYTDTDLNCRGIPPDALDEAQNAYIADYTNLPRCRGLMRAFTALGAANGRQNGFVVRPRSNSAYGQPFDDIVDWMSADELVKELEDYGVLPVELLPPVGLEDY